MSNQRILITGGLGYLGGRIANFLQDYPEATITLGTRRELSGIPNWAKSFKIIHLDLCKISSIEKAVSRSDTIIHLAALDEKNSLRFIDFTFKSYSILMCQKSDTSSSTSTTTELKGHGHLVVV